MCRTKRATIHDVSKMAGVSIATVSRVIHQNGRFSDETEQRVRDAMAKLDYKPDVLAQGMRTQAMPIVAVIMPDILDDNLALMIRTTQARLNEAGLSTIYFNSGEDPQRSQQFIDQMHAQHISGIIYVPDRGYTALDFHHIPVVFFNRRPPHPLATDQRYIGQSNAQTGGQVVDWLVKDGKHQIMILTDKGGILSQQERLEGALAALKRQGLTPAAQVAINVQRTSEAVAAVREQISAGLNWDAIFCTSVRSTIGAMSALKEAGLTPEQVTVAGFGVHRLYRYGLIDYRAVYEPIQEMSVAAAEAMLKLIACSGEEP